MKDIKKTTRKKYPLLSDKVWLHKHYVEESLSTSEIARKIGGTRDGVRAALLRHGIPRRTTTESNKEVRERKGEIEHKYPLLDNEKWLREKYEQNKASLNDIAVLAGAKNHNSVRQALTRFGVDIRNISEGLTANREDDGFIIDEEVIAGCLLGDGYLQKHNKQSEDSYPNFQKKNIYYDHMEFVGKILFKDKWEDRVKSGNRLLNGKRFSHFQMRSLTHKKLMPIYKKWYPESNNFIKVVPSDIPMTKTVLLHWFLDDGYSSLRKRKDCNQKKKQVVLGLCSECFSKEDQQMLCDKMKDRWGLIANPCYCHNGTGYMIKISQSQAPKFFDIIGPPPVPSLAYKWK